MRLSNFICAGALLLAGCAHYVVNERLDHFDPKAGYRFRPAEDADANRVLVIVTLSGGGTRAAAFAYGALQALDAAKLPGDPARSLLDEVDLISSVSGGSFTAAWYGLHGKGIFDDFQTRVLERNIQGDLAWQVANPLNWPRLASPLFDRIDLAAEYYDRELFDHKTFADLARGKHRPFIVLNASDMAVGARFEFTQDQFDLLYSDLDRFPIGRAVAASSAFPILLTPVRLLNHPAGSDFEQPLWIENGLLDAGVNPTRHARATVANSYLEPDDGGAAKHRRFIHLLDGGIADNIGLRGPMVGLTSNDSSSSFLNLINNDEVDRVVVIAVDAKTQPDHDWDQVESSPSDADVLLTVCTTPMDNYSTDTVRIVEGDFKARTQQQDEREAIQKIVREQFNVPTFTLGELEAVHFHLVHVTFDRIADPARRQRLEHVPTSFRLPHGEVELVINAAKEVLEKPLKGIVEEMMVRPR